MRHDLPGYEASLVGVGQVGKIVTQRSYQAGMNMTVTLPSDVLRSVGITTEAELRLVLAIALCREVKATTAQAAAIAGIDRVDFQKVLAEWQVPAYDEEEWEHDLRVTNYPRQS